MTKYEISDTLWERIAPLLPKMKKRRGFAGRNPVWSWRQILDAIFWLLRTGSQWSALPSEFPPRSTVHDRFQLLKRENFFVRLSQQLGSELEGLGLLDLREGAIDGTFVSAKRGGEAVGKTKRGKGSKVMVMTEKNGIPISVTVCSASPHEVTLVEDTLDCAVTSCVPEYLLGDGAYDSDPLDEKLLQQRGVKMIAPHRKNRVAPTTQDGREFRRYARRWKVERANAWFHNYRRVLVRWERDVDSYLSFLLLAFADLLARRLES